MNGTDSNAIYLKFISRIILSYIFYAIYTHYCFVFCKQTVNQVDMFHTALLTLSVLFFFFLFCNNNNIRKKSNRSEIHSDAEIDWDPSRIFALVICKNSLNHRLESWHTTTKTSTKTRKNLTYVRLP